MSRFLRPLALAVVLAGAPAAVQAQVASAAPADSMAFPRQVVKWFTTAQADSLYNHAGEQLKASMQSSAQVTAMMGRMASQLGEYKSVDAEAQFEQNGTRVYIAAASFTTAPEPAAIVVRYQPGTPVIQGMTIQPLSRVKERFPEAKLP